MISSKSLFLSVYASSGLIRLLFLPLCYLFLASPFLLLALRYLKVYQKVPEIVPKEYSASDIGLPIIFTVVWTCIATRFLSNRNNVSIKHDGKRRVQFLPYWIPAFRHWGNVTFGGEGWLKGVRESSITNIIAYNSAGAKHNIILSAALLDQIVGNSDSMEEAELIKWSTLHNAFGLPQNAKDQYFQLQPSISKTLETELFKGKQLKNIVSASLETLSQSLPDLITFNSSIVDQLPWERVAGLELTDGTEEAECGLFALINEFFCNAILPPITGAQLPESYQLLASDLETLNQHFFALAMGFPRLFPKPGLPGAALARKRLLQNLTKFFNDLTNPPAKKNIRDDESMSGEEETDAETPTPLTALNDLFSKHDLPTPARASITLDVLHRLVSQAVPLAFWTILHIYCASTPVSNKDKDADYEITPLIKIRGETHTWAEAIQPPAIHPSFPSPPEISFTSIAPLFNPSSFTYLRSCIFEARRLYGDSITTARVTKPITFGEITARGDQEKWELDIGSYIDIGLSQRLINTSSANYLSPEQYKPDRFPHSQSPSPLASSVFDDSEELISALVIALVAGITQLWDITAAPKKGVFEHIQEAQTAAAGGKLERSQGRERKAGIWTVPKAVNGASVKIPKTDVRVRIRRREGLDGPKTMRKGR